jgi:glycosyltransferase involved in cell wall biosynthesis
VDVRSDRIRDLPGVAPPRGSPKLTRFAGRSGSIPNLFVVGAMKSGTTTAYEMLAASPDISMSAIKEPNHFCVDLFDHPDFPLTRTVHRFANTHWIRNDEQYSALFSGAHSRWAGEASTTYLYSEAAAKEIYRANPDARIIILLRNPIDRAYSEYLMNLSTGVTLEPFSKVIRDDFERVRAGGTKLFERYVFAGLYARQVKRYLDIFPKDQLLVEIVDRPEIGFDRLSERLGDFLGVEIGSVDQSAELTNSAKIATLPRLNRLLYSTGMKGAISRLAPNRFKGAMKRNYYRPAENDEMDAQDRAFLADVFGPDIEQLAKLLGEDIGFWLDPASDLAGTKAARSRIAISRSAFTSADRQPANDRGAPKSIAFVWTNFGPYHSDRLMSAAAYFAGRKIVRGIEIARATAVYPWDRIDQIASIEHTTLFPEQRYEDIPTFRRIRALTHALLKRGTDDIFLCHYEMLEILVVASILRLCGRRVYLMIESKFDDKPRTLFQEMRKIVAFWPYIGALVGGNRTRQYLQFFGFADDTIHDGYDTVSGDRVRRLAGLPPAPNGAPFEDRHFTIVARLVRKKNLGMAIRAFDRYRRISSAPLRDLHIFGSGECEGELRTLIDELSVPGVQMHGFVQAPAVAAALGTSLALVLPSREEQWGLVVNEALAMGLPILCSENVGARDSLVKAGVNGMIFEPDNIEGLARFMTRLSEDKSEWIRFCEGSLVLAGQGDTRRFAEGVDAALGEKAAPELR